MVTTGNGFRFNNCKFKDGVSAIYCYFDNGGHSIRDCQIDGDLNAPHLTTNLVGWDIANCTIAGSIVADGMDNLAFQCGTARLWVRRRQ
jgi:hypothetical protein